MSRHEQDNEEAAELLATIQSDHVPMKTWYNNNAQNNPDLNAFRLKYGPKYPDFARDVSAFFGGATGWKDIRRVYLRSKSNSSHNNNGSNSNSGQPRKRRSRWGRGGDDGNAPVVGGQQEQQQKKRRSRWANANPSAPATATAAAAASKSAGILSLLPGIPANMTAEQLSRLSNLQSKLRSVNEKLNGTFIEVEAMRVDALPRGHRDRSPSPPPEYDSMGKRKNTRAVRWRERYSQERADLLDQLLELHPSLKPAAGSVLQAARRKRISKIPIPVDEHPGYNFIGLIIGPRGKTQKELESKTNCKIAIRGKGSVKVGARGGKTYDGMDEPLHVLIAGDKQEDVDKATDLIEQMLVVIDDDQNQFKQNQLRELALLNGTLKDDDYCILCAEKGHKQFECPKRFSLKNKIQVKCAICGDSSHPTRDCTQNKDGGKAATADEQKKLDSEYLSFMAELDGTKNESKDGVSPAVTCLPVTAPAPALAATDISAIVQEAKQAIPTPAVAPPPLPPPPRGPPPPYQNNQHLPPPPGAHNGHLLPPPGRQHLPPMQMPPPPHGIPPPNYYAQPPPSVGSYPPAAAAPNTNHAGGDDELAGWDPNSYYGHGMGSAGGFDWWTNNSG